MTVPAAPTAGEPIAEAWGDVVHDAVVGMDIQAGEAPFTVTSAVLKTDIIVTFSRPFASTPIVVCSVAKGSTGVINFNAGVVAQSPTGATFGVREVREASSTFTGAIQWIAYGPRA